MEVKPIYNWEKASVVDIETDNLLDDLTKMHIVGIKLDDKDVTTIEGDNHERIKKMLSYHISNNIPIVGHNFIGFDVPAMEKVLGIDLSDLMVIDTLWLSYYLNINNKSHSIETLIKEYDTDVEKYIVDAGAWEDLSWEDAVARVTSDVEANTIIWEDFKSRLIDMYTLAKEQIDAGNVGGKRVSKDEVIYLDSLKDVALEEHINKILTFIMFKADCARLQEKTRWKVDVEYLKESRDKLLTMREDAKGKLEGLMPPVPQYRKCLPPKKPFKKNGELSVTGQRWENLKAQLSSGETDEYGNPLAKVVEQGVIHSYVGVNPPNLGSHQQVKDFLFSKGWEPETFDYKKDKEALDEWFSNKPPKGASHFVWQAWKDDKPKDRAVPQVTVEVDDEKELCPSVKKLISKVPELVVLEDYSTITHRYNLAEGFLRDVSKDGYLKARIGGMTNTLRSKHREIVNLPKAEKLYAEFVRGSLIAEKGYALIGSDLKSLEDRVKHHFMIPYDPKYVEQMSGEDYDPHIAMAIQSGMITEEDAVYYREHKHDKDDDRVGEIAFRRAKGKTANYAYVYGSGAATVARSAEIPLKEAEQLREAYWKINWSVLEIAKDQVDITDSLGRRWLVNPINGFLYSVRSDKDIFSTLIQGTGSFFFDCWIDNILTEMENRWNNKTLTGSFHDEGVFKVRDSEKAIDSVCEVIKASIEKVNTTYLLRRKLGCDTQVGYRYSEIH